MIKETKDNYIVHLEVYVEEMNRYDYVVYIDKALDGPSGPEDAYRMAAESVHGGNECVDDVEYGVFGEEGMYSSLGNNRQINYQLEKLNKELYGYRMALDCLLDAEPHDAKKSIQNRVDYLVDKIEQLEMARYFNIGENTDIGEDV
jgi:hypothetical protein